MYVQFYTDYDMKLFFFLDVKKQAIKCIVFFPMIVNFQEVQIDFFISFLSDTVSIQTFLQFNFCYQDDYHVVRTQGLK